jgi:hypothetical protein
MNKPVKELKSESPIFTALSVQRAGANYLVVQYQIQDGKIISSTPIQEPQFKQDALNSFKITAAKLFMGDM